MDGRQGSSGHPGGEVVDENHGDGSAVAVPGVAAPVGVQAFDGREATDEALNRAAPEQPMVPRPRPPADEPHADFDLLTNPAHVLPPLGPAPADLAAQKDWLDAYHERLALRRAAAELRKWTADAARAELELAEARRRDADARAEASRDLVYTFYSEVGEESVRAAMHTLGSWSRREPGKPMTIVLNSPGGRVLDGLAL